MGNEKYLNFYVDVLTNTMTDAVIRNISLQANARVTEEVVNDQVKRNEDLAQQITNLHNEIKELKNSSQQSENTKVTDLENKVKGHLERIGDLEKQLNDLVKIRNEYDNIKHQVTHVDTFRNELIKERENHKNTSDGYEARIKELNDQIEYLQLTPAKRKKIDDEKNKQVETVELEVISTLPLDDTIKDGGSF